MGTTLAASTYDVDATVLGIRFVLSVTVRIGTTANVINVEKLSSMIARTIATWERVMEAVLNGSFKIAVFEGGEWLSAEITQNIAVQEDEPFVTVWNKEFSSHALSITVHSWDNGAFALHTALSMIEGLAKIKKHAFHFGFDKLDYAPLPSPKLEAPKSSKPSYAPDGMKDIDNIDDFLPFYGDSTATAKDFDETGMQFPFRFYKQLAPNVISLQEFKPGGGGDKYQKSAIQATLPYHATNPQYEDDSLIYYAITGEITIVKGQYGIQAIIPTEKGRVYVSMNQKNGEESPNWAILAQDLGNEYSRLLHDAGKFFTHDCVLVMKSAKQKDGKQYKNYYRVFQPFKA